MRLVARLIVKQVDVYTFIELPVYSLNMSTGSMLQIATSKYNTDFTMH